MIDLSSNVMFMHISLVSYQHVCTKAHAIDRGKHKPQTARVARMLNHAQLVICKWFTVFQSESQKTRVWLGSWMFHELGGSQVVCRSLLGGNPIKDYFVDAFWPSLVCRSSSNLTILWTSCFLSFDRR